MPPNPQQTSHQKPAEVPFQVAGMNNGRYLGPSETSLSAKQATLLGSDETQSLLRLSLEEAKTQLDALVKACVAGEDNSPFTKHKERLVADLAPPYALYRFVQSDPDLVTMPRQHDALQDRVRKIPKSKIALMCLYCKMQPGNDDEKKSCSDWTIWLEQANHENKTPDEFVNWAMDANFKECREKVRERRRAEKKPEGQSSDAASPSRLLSLRETAKGADITLYGQKFSIPKTLMAEIIELIMPAAPKNLNEFSNDNNEGNDCE